MLDKLVKDGYEVFSRYKLNTTITGCYCGVCLNEDYNKYLHEIPLNNIKGRDLMLYIQSVDIEKEGCNDLKYFFPKFLEIIYLNIQKIEESDFCIFIWSLLDRIDYSLWEKDEKLLVINFFSEYWSVTKEPKDIELSDFSIDGIKSTVFKSLAL